MAFGSEPQSWRGQRLWFWAGLGWLGLAWAGLGWLGLAWAVAEVDFSWFLLTEYGRGGRITARHERRTNTHPTHTQHTPHTPMSETTLTFDGQEPETKLSVVECVAMFRAACLLHEPCTLVHAGRNSRSSDMPRPDRLNEMEARQAEKILTWRLGAVLMQLGIKFEMPEPFCEGPPFIEAGDGYTIAPSYEPGQYRRAAERWHVFDPEGDPLVENVSMDKAVLELWTRIDATRKRQAIAAALDALF